MPYITEQCKTVYTDIIALICCDNVTAKRHTGHKFRPKSITQQQLKLKFIHTTIQWAKLIISFTLITKLLLGKETF